MYNDLLKYPNVVGAGIGKKNLVGPQSIVVMVRKKVPLEALKSAHVIPTQAYGFATDVIEVGNLIIHNERTGKWRPTPGGVSVGHYKITAGTLGCAVSNKLGDIFILSNNHVLANQNDAEIGDEIYQPGPYDGGISSDFIAYLSGFVPIEFTEDTPTCPFTGAAVKFLNWLSGLIGSSHRLKAIKISDATNLVDAAIAIANRPYEIDPKILEIGMIHEITKPELGMQVCKSGRSTGLTQGEIIVLDATVTVQYDARKYATFERQIVTGPMSAPGDSGSLLVNQFEGANYAVGLLFGGSDKVTIYNPIDAVLEALEIEF